MVGKTRQYRLYVNSQSANVNDCDGFRTQVVEGITSSHKTSATHLDVSFLDFRELSNGEPPCKFECLVEVHNTSNGKGRANHFISKDLVDTYLRSMREVRFHTFSRK